MAIDYFFNWPEIRRTVGPCIRPGGPLLTRRAIEVCRLLPGSRVADIGSGAGGTLEYLNRTGLQTVGLDHSEMLLGEAALRIAQGRLVRGQAEILPFKEGVFDALFCECVVSILSDRIAALREFTRVLKEGGFLIVSDVFRRGGPGQARFEAKSNLKGTKTLLQKEDLVSFLITLGFPLLLWEEHERVLKEFVARMILAGVPILDLWMCRQERDRKTPGGAEIGYFLLIARKEKPVQSL